MQSKNWLTRLVGTLFTVCLLSGSSMGAQEYGWDGCCPVSCEPEAPCGHLRLSGSYLYWKPCAKGLSLGRELSFSANSETEQTLIGADTKNLDFKFDSGFKVEAGYGSPCCNWDVALAWTYFKSDASATLSSNLSSESNPVVVQSDWIAATVLFPAQQVGRWKMALDLVDLTFGYTFCFQDCFFVRPSFGIRGARLDQSYHVGTNVLVNIFGGGGAGQAAIKSVCDLKAIGPRLGVDMQFVCGSGLSLFGFGGASLLYGKFHTHSDAALKRVPTQSGFPDPDLEITNPFAIYDIKGGTPSLTTTTVVDLGIGVKWERCFETCQKKFDVSLAAAWEFHAFYDVNQFDYDSLPIDWFLTLVGSDRQEERAPAISPENHRKFGDLTMQGLTVSLTLGF